MKIFDCFLLGGFGIELDLLEIRLNELYDLVDCFVIVEAQETHLGEKKPLYFQDSNERFAKFSDKIIYYVSDPLTSDKPWENENKHRNQIAEALKKTCIENDDRIIISDLDEIPSRDSIQELRQITSVPIGIPLSYRPFYLNLEGGEATVGCRVINYKSLQTITPQDVRNTDFKVMEYPRTKSFGFHFSYQGGIQAIKAKIASFAHGNDHDPRLKKLTKETTELDIEIDLLGIKSNLSHPISNNFRKVTIDGYNSFPRYVIDNQEKFKDWFL